MPELNRKIKSQHNGESNGAHPATEDVSSVSSVSGVVDSVHKLTEADLVLKAQDKPPEFPLDVLPPTLQEYVQDCAKSIHCQVDLPCVLLFPVAGAAIGKAEKRLQVKDGFKVSSCIWAALLDLSSSGKTPALNFIQNFFIAHQLELVKDWEARCAEARAHATKFPPYPTLYLTDTTMESLQRDLHFGPVLYARDELGGWVQQMSQYKANCADRSDWCSIWSHNAISLGRRNSGKVVIEYPFTGVAGTMIPQSYASLNDGGHEDDGLVHRLLAAYPLPKMPRFTLDGVKQKLIDGYKADMTKLFKKDFTLLTYQPDALQELMKWTNGTLYGELGSESPGWLISKYRKLSEYAHRLCLVLHEIKRVCGENVAVTEVDLDTAKRVITLLEYFRGHIPRIHAVLNQMREDVVDKWYYKLRHLHLISARQCTHRSIPERNASKATVLRLWALFEERGYGRNLEDLWFEFFPPRKPEEEEDKDEDEEGAKVKG
jgi:hypothetical protein